MDWSGILLIIAGLVVSWGSVFHIAIKDEVRRKEALKWLGRVFWLMVGLWLFAEILALTLAFWIGSWFS